MGEPPVDAQGPGSASGAEKELGKVSVNGRHLPRGLTSHFVGCSSLTGGFLSFSYSCPMTVSVRQAWNL